MVRCQEELNGGNQLREWAPHVTLSSVFDREVW